MNDGALRIGITIGLRDEAESLWANGIKHRRHLSYPSLMESS